MDIFFQGCVHDIVNEFGCTLDNVKDMLQQEEVREGIVTLDTIGCGKKLYEFDCKNSNK